MSEIQIAARYAKSLIGLAEEKGLLDEVHQDMQLFVNTCNTSRPLRLMLENPIVNNYAKLQALRKIFSGKITALTTSFFEIIVRKTREALLYQIAEQVVAQYRMGQNLEDAEVITAAELTDELREHFKSIATKISGGKKITLKEVIKPELIGGFILNVRDNQIDSSVKSRLDGLRLQLAK
jgi:F-type H+-transporting ATPase subunit delta